MMCVLFLNTIIFLSGVMKTKEYKSRCTQVNMLMNDVRGSEDCLYLNIWVPHGKSGNKG